MGETILVLNAGSSSIKFELFSIGRAGSLDRELKGQLEGTGTRPRLFAKDTQGKVLIDRTWPEVSGDEDPGAFEKVVGFLREQPIAIGHRVVHGGSDFEQPVVVDRSVLARLEKLSPLAPLHQPNSLRPIRAALERLPGTMQVACFDTAFHRGHPKVADHFAIPEHLHRDGVRRYGFHGLSYEYISGRIHEVAPEIASGRVVVAHLGSGASLCAMKDGRSVESTMGFTALDGLPMGTRPGQLDPGVVLYLMQQRGMGANEIEHLLYHDCGLKGLSGISSDVRTLLKSESENAKFAIDFFVYRILMLTGALAAAMGGIDGFVFTAGIGENAPGIRHAVASGLGWLGLELDPEAVSRGEPRISKKSSRIACFVIPTDEEWMIARHTLHVLRSKKS
jgi:acetate kinase